MGDEKNDSMPNKFHFVVMFVERLWPLKETRRRRRRSSSSLSLSIELVQLIVHFWLHFLRSFVGFSREFLLLWSLMLTMDEGTEPHPMNRSTDEHSMSMSTSMSMSEEEEEEDLTLVDRCLMNVGERNSIDEHLRSILSREKKLNFTDNSNRNIVVDVVSMTIHLIGQQNLYFLLKRKTNLRLIRSK